MIDKRPEPNRYKSKMRLFLPLATAKPLID
jgi:hypothetical protein